MKLAASNADFVCPRNNFSVEDLSGLDTNLLLNGVYFILVKITTGLDFFK